MATDPTSPPAASRKPSSKSILWWSYFAGRLIIGAILIYAAYGKLRQRWIIFAMSVDNFHMLPQWGVNFVARTLPWAEMIVGAMLILGLWVRWAGLVATAMSAVFFAANLHAYLSGSELDCGCFGANVQLSRRTVLLLDAAMVLVAAGVTIFAFLARRRSRQSA
ncbi:MAG: MauE/DoxX family redox-associated membrane protein [Candidatus Acidiferrales bacterium]